MRLVYCAKVDMNCRLNMQGGVGSPSTLGQILYFFKVAIRFVFVQAIYCCLPVNQYFRVVCPRKIASQWKVRPPHLVLAQASCLPCLSSFDDPTEPSGTWS